MDEKILQRAIEFLDELQSDLLYGSPDIDDAANRVGVVIAMLKGEYDPDEEKGERAQAPEHVRRAAAEALLASSDGPLEPLDAGAGERDEDDEDDETCITTFSDPTTRSE